MKIATIIGARPQFIKAAAVSRAIARHNAEGHASDRITEVIVHTGQHYDDGMSAVFFRELCIPEPAYSLQVGSGPHGLQTGRMLAGIEKVLVKEQPDWVLVYGDTNSTLAGALAAAKLHFPIAHVEAGLRSFNRRMPEEINRIVADHLSDLLFCPSKLAADTLEAEGIHRNVVVTGDVMADALRFAAEKAEKKPAILQSLCLTEKGYLMATLHRAGNTDDIERLQGILSALFVLSESEPVLVPLHPRTRNVLIANDLFDGMPNSSKGNKHPRANLHFIEPTGYFESIGMLQSARLLLTDSGGMQKEAYWLKVPCITLRDETEWKETLNTGWNRLAGADKDRILAAARGFSPPTIHPLLYGDGHAAEKILKLLCEADKSNSNIPNSHQPNILCAK